VLVLLLAGGVDGFALPGARDLDALLFAGHIREARGWAVLCGCG
jgi:hypothetical protein